jgi:hypothetical protein
MPIINGQIYQSPDIPSNGVLSKPKQPILPILPEKTTIVYDGATLQRIPAAAIPNFPDGSNNPSYCVIGGIVLSADIILPLKNDKILAESQIIDGVTVFEHVSRKAAEIDFEFTIFPPGVINGTASNTNAYNNATTFNQQSLNAFWSNLWLINSVQDVQNTYLNGLGITQVILKSIAVQPERGKPNIIVKVKALENQIAYSNAFSVNTLISSSATGSGF